ncbi:MAG TPA: invasion associated locus B family protein [Rhizomicrobium sp.]|jgi:invasion protein IalB
MTNLTQKLALGAASLAVGLVLGWAVRGTATYNTATQAMTSYESWRVACPAANQKDVNCEMIQDVLDSQSHSEITRIAIVHPVGGKLTLNLTMPLGVALEPGVGLTFQADTDSKDPKDQKAAKDAMITAKYRTCTQQGCVVDIPIDDKLQSQLDGDKDGRLVFVSANDTKPIAIPLSLKGYGAAKRAYNNSEAKRSSWFWRMWS